jgi:hypothetical protein
LTVVTLYVAILLICALCAFVALLARKDISPRIAFEKFRNRIARRPPVFLPNFHDAPYRRLPGKAPAHHPTLLNIRTSEGTGQACHPDVAFSKEGFGEQHWKYWMACTPYAYCHFVLENPEVFASHDGLTWVIPQGAMNPVVPSPPASWDHNSDPDILFVGQRLWLYYRETLRTARPVTNKIFLTMTDDGVRWTPPKEVVSETGEEALLMSPAVIHDGTGFHMFTVGRLDGSFELARRESTDGSSWSQPTSCSVEGFPSDHELWHLDVFRESDRLSAIFVSAKDLSQNKLHYGFSRDGGLTWQLDGLLLDPSFEFEEGFLYRTTLLKKDLGDQEYELWYSAANRRGMFSIAHLRMIREGDRMVPCSMQTGVSR